MGRQRQGQRRAGQQHGAGGWPGQRSGEQSGGGWQRGNGAKHQVVFLSGGPVSVAKAVGFGPR